MLGVRPLLITGLLAAVLILSGAGCGTGEKTATDQDGHNKSQASANETTSSQTGQMRIDDSGWKSFQSLGDRINSGEQLSLAELSTLGDENTFRIWRDCQKSNVPSADRIGRWLEGAFWNELGRTGPMKLSGARKAMIKSYQYSYDSRESLDRRIQEWSSPTLQKKFLTRAHRWVDPINLPDHLTIQFLPTLPELRFCSGNLLVDTGVLLASTNRQLEGQLVAILYRNYQATQAPAHEGPDDPTPTAENSVAKTFLFLQNEGIPTWIEDSPNTIFSKDHYSLFKVSFIPDNFFQNGIRSIDFMNEYLPKMFSDPETMNRIGPIFSKEARAGGTLAQAGYAMVGTIIHHLGEEKLLEVRNSVPDFVAAYQEAALRNPDPRPILGAQGSHLPEAMPSLDPKLFDQLHQLLLREFPH
ncbi:MAG: hypothetical protein KOO60_08015 [Gemmatimonadales bacterium]|nr:hypothetical protein [Gemmatimonadales bacterium]